ADFHLDARVLVGEELVAGAERPVEIGLDPVVVAGGLEANVAADEAQAGDAIRRIGLRAGILLENRDGRRKKRQSERGEHRLADGTTRCAHVMFSPMPTPFATTVGKPQKLSFRPRLTGWRHNNVKGLNARLPGRALCEASQACSAAIQRILPNASPAGRETPHAQLADAAEAPLRCRDAGVV